MIEILLEQFDPNYPIQLRSVPQSESRCRCDNCRKKLRHELPSEIAESIRHHHKPEAAESNKEAAWSLCLAAHMAGEYANGSALDAKSFDQDNWLLQGARVDAEKAASIAGEVAEAIEA